MNKLLLILLCLSGTLHVHAAGGYEAKNFIASPGDTLRYRILFPPEFDATQKYPLVLFLHGAGERGDDNTRQLTHGSCMFTNPVNREKYPAVVLFPQCPADKYWFTDKRPETFSPERFPENPPLSGSLKQVTGLLYTYLDSGYIDSRRIYIIGISMGGMATFDMICRNPGLFAAAIPICGMINPKRLKEANIQTAVRIYHGDADRTVPVEGSRKAYTALKEGGGNVEYTEFPGCHHDSWNPAFNRPDFLSWLFKQTK